MISLFIGGDFVPTQSNVKYFNDGNIETVFDTGILNFMKDADFRIFNLEAPLCDEASPILKCGPNLSIPTMAINGIKKLNPSVLCLANNHILDHGILGLNSTIECLQNSNIPYVGIGKNVNDATRPYIIEKDGIKVGIFCCCEHEFSVASEHEAGANPFDVYSSFDNIQELSRNVDFIVVLYHGGREHYRYPSPLLQKTCHKFVDVGANVVICQHSHCIGCEEKYKNSQIIYGQGNFLFDMLDREEWQSGLLLKLFFDKQNGISIEKSVISKDNYKVKTSDIPTKETILQEMNNRSKKILDKGFIQNEYKKEALESIKCYTNAFSSLNLYAMRNYLDCEAHREIFSFALESSKQEDFHKFSAPKRKFFGKVKAPNGRRIFYFFGKKIFSYKKT